MEVKNFDEIKIIDDVERLIILRKRLDMKQYEFAKQIGVSASYIGQVENYQTPFTPNLKRRIDNFLIRREKELDEANLFSDIKGR
jgi:transcriptional regulator with XRE-family HTH domain